MPGDGEDMSDESSLNKIEFDAQVKKVQTMAEDNTIRATLDLSEGETVTMAKLAECARFGVVLHIVAIPRATDERPKRTKSY
jgi:selenophosphate synthetase-related protein